MACLELQGTKLTFSILPYEDKDGYWAKTQIAVENEYVSYRMIDELFTFEELETLIFSMHRLLAGAYAKECNLSFEKAGIAVDLYAHTENGKELSREERRQKDCFMLFRTLLKSSDKRSFLGGVYTFILHRKEIEKLATALKTELDKAFVRNTQTGKYLFVGVSPKGYKGCNYWYLDTSKTVKSGEYVWVRMGRHNTEQVVFVDSVRYFDEDSAPYPPEKVKQVIRKANEEEIEQAVLSWKQERGE